MQPAKSHDTSHISIALPRKDHAHDDLQAAFQNFLRTAKDTLGTAIDDADGLENSMTFEVCLGGELYHVCIEQTTPPIEVPGRRLSLRELEIARLISKGMPNKAIASALNLSPCTVSTYTKRIYLKLNVSSRTEMVAKILGGHSFRAAHSSA